MASQPEFTRRRLRKLTNFEENDLRDMIQPHLVHRPMPSAISRDSSSSSIGRLDVLPQELLLEVLDLLDFQSLSRLSRVSLKGKRAVEALPSYRDVMIHSPAILGALGATRLLQIHSAALLRHVLLEGQCVSCFEFGAFLFLPTCERVCFDCLHENLALHMTTVTFAKRWFALTDDQIGRIPILHSIPGSYCVMWQVTHRQIHRLVSIKQLKQLAIDVHGSPENVAKLMPKDSSGMEYNEFHTLRRFHEAPLEPPGCDLSRLPPDENYVRDKYCGMASIRMPVLTSSGPDYGRLCLGCKYEESGHFLGSRPFSAVGDPLPPNMDPARLLLATLTRLRAKSGFIDHIRECSGIRRMLHYWGDDF
ncbi:hypothetical protein AUP68_06563 [Ilyonectria robusta]